MISHKHKAIFIHVPKCAGNTVNDLLNRIIEFSPIHKTPEPFDRIDSFFPYKHYLDVIKKVRFLHGNVSALKACSQNLYLLGKSTLKLNHKYNQNSDWLSGQFRDGIYTSLTKSLNNQIYNEYYTFSFVRNPYDRAVSVWGFFCAERYKEGNLNVSFPVFMRAVVNSDYQSLHPNLIKEVYSGIEWHAMPQVTHLKNKSGHIAIDFIGKTESFEADLQIISKKLNLPTLEHKDVRLNSSSHRPYQSYYTPELQELVYNFYKEDFETFDYHPELL